MHCACSGLVLGPPEGLLEQQVAHGCDSKHEASEDVPDLGDGVWRQRVVRPLLRVEAEFLLGGAEAGLDSPAQPGDPGQFGERGLRRRADDVVGTVRGIPQAAPDQQPAISGRLLQTRQALPHPIVEPRFLGTLTSRNAVPSGGGQGSGDLRGACIATPPSVVIRRSLLRTAST